MFEKATRLKLRFETNRGDVSSEDLWDIPLSDSRGFSLDCVAKALSKSVTDSKEESFVVKRKGADAVLELKFEIVKHVIAVKLDELEKREKAAENKVKKEKIMSIIEDKQDNALAGKSVAALTKMLDEL